VRAVQATLYPPAPTVERSAISRAIDELNDLAEAER
jgi:hypothetical protein